MKLAHGEFFKDVPQIIGFIKDISNSGYCRFGVISIFEFKTPRIHAASLLSYILLSLSSNVNVYHFRFPLVVLKQLNTNKSLITQDLISDQIFWSVLICSIVIVSPEIPEDTETQNNLFYNPVYFG